MVWAVRIPLPEGQIISPAGRYRAALRLPDRKACRTVHRRGVPFGESTLQTEWPVWLRSGSEMPLFPTPSTSRIDGCLDGGCGRQFSHRTIFGGYSIQRVGGIVRIVCKAESLRPIPQ